MKPVRFRAVVLVIITFFITALLLLFVHQLVLPVVAFLVPGLETSFYDLGVYGAAPKQDHVSFELSAPRATILRWDDQCNDGFVLLTPSGSSVAHPGPMILDSRGRLVWIADSYEVTTNLEVQRYRGQNCLTFWSGKKAQTSGKGVYYVLDSTYNVIAKISAVGDNFHGDLHEFKITKDNTALLTIYNHINADLSSMGRPTKGWIADSVFQEIDIATGKLLFEWRASDHFSANESYMTNPFAGYIPSIPFDFFHINSVDKDSRGNYLISSRHLHTITCISPTGDTLWILGGRHNQFIDLSDGGATSFKWQHDARWVSEDEGIMTLFDNQEGGILHVDAPYSQGLMIKLDVQNRTATLLHSYTSLQQTRTPSQGSLQVLPETGNVFIGWGHSAAYSEFTSTGKLLCETHFGASWFYFFGRVVSYRAFKTVDWVGRPLDAPLVKIQGNKLYVSWNGATEVVAWELQGMEMGEETIFGTVDVVEKEGFESSFKLPSAPRYTGYRVAALDRDRQVLGVSEVVEQVESSDVLFKSGLALVGCLVVLESVRLYSQRVLRGRKGYSIGWKGYQYHRF